jgi:ERCC4-type nuclease
VRGSDDGGIFSRAHANLFFAGISNDRLDFLRKHYETEKRKILDAYEKDMTDYKNKKFQLQKELESCYYSLAERALKTTKTSEEEFLQRQDELKNSVSVFINASACYIVAPFAVFTKR